MSDLEKQVERIQQQLYNLRELQTDRERREFRNRISSLESKLLYRIEHHEKASENERSRIERRTQEKINFFLILLGLVLSIISAIGVYSIFTYVQRKADSYLEEQRTQVSEMTNTFEADIATMLGNAKEKFQHMEDLAISYARTVNHLMALDEDLRSEEIPTRIIKEGNQFNKILQEFKEEKDYTPVDWTIKGRTALWEEEYSDALKHFNKAIAEHEEDDSLYYYIAITYEKLNDYKKAINNYEKAIQFNPNAYDVMNNLAWILATNSEDGLREGETALKWALKSNEIVDYEHPYLLDTLAAAYAETGNFEKAIEYQEKAIDKAANSEFHEEYISRLQLYKSNKAYRQP